MLFMIRLVQVLCYLAAFALTVWVIKASFRLAASRQEYRLRLRSEQVARQEARRKDIIGEYLRAARRYPWDLE